MTAILVDEAFCTRCGICSAVCPSLVIVAADENALPRVAETRAGMCSACGHCEAFCPSQALRRDGGAEERVHIPAGGLEPGDLGVYLKRRRSIRHYTDEPVARETILQLLDIARYAPSGCNGQPVQWLVVHDPEKVNRIAGLTIEWMKTLVNSSHPMSGFVPGLIRAWEAGYDVICRGAPHLLFAHIPESNPIAPIDAIIALAHFDIAAPAFSIGTCWAGFVAAASREYPPLQEMLAIPEGRVPACAMMFGHPRFRVCGIPGRNRVQVAWQ